LQKKKLKHQFSCIQPYAYIVTVPHTGGLGGLGLHVNSKAQKWQAIPPGHCKANCPMKTNQSDVNSIMQPWPTPHPQNWRVLANGF
jgi:hypothetical protein